MGFVASFMLAEVLGICDFKACGSKALQTYILATIVSTCIPQKHTAAGRNDTRINMITMILLYHYS